MTAVIETSAWRFALVGTPNSGKTALFNALTGSRQKVANYPGVTVERKAGMLQTRVGPSRQPDRSARHLFAARPQPRRGDHPRRGARPDGQRVGARSSALRRRRHQSPRRAPPRHGIEARRPADAADPQHDRHRAPARHRHRPGEAVRRARRAGGDLHRGAPRRHRGLACAHRPDGGERGAGQATPSTWQPPTLADLRAAQREADRVIKAAISAPKRPDTADRQGRWRAAASGGGPRHPAGALVRHVPGGVRLGEAPDGPDPVRLRRARRTGPHRAARRPAGKLHPERRDLRRRLGDRVPAADPDPVPVHPAAGRPRLHGARGVPDGQDHGRRGPARPRLHSAAVELRLRDPRNHGDARDRQQARPPHHHPGRAADDLLGAHPGLYADHLGVHPRQDGVWLHGPARARHVRPLRRRHLQRARRVVHQQPLLPARRRHAAVHAGIARLQDSAAQERAARPLHPRHDVPEARRHHDLLDDGADLVPGVVPAAARGRRRARRSTTASPPSSANGWSR